MLARPFVKTAALATALALPLALAVAAPATAATVTVTTWGDVKAAFLIDGDTVVLGADITAPSAESLAVDLGEAITLDLNGHTLSITTPPSTAAAVGVPDTSTLTINATGGGTLNATGGQAGAGIGGGIDTAGGTTTINGGTINATGGQAGAGIGGGYYGAGGTTTINGGTTTATGGQGGAGIGGGYNRAGGTTTINGGTITATGGENGAGIGGGHLGVGGTTTINGGTITATGGSGSAGIGGGNGDGGAGGGGSDGGGGGSDGGITTINGGTTSATGGVSGAGIGGGNLSASGGFTTLTGGTTTATGGASASGIGSGDGGGGNSGALDIHGFPNTGAALDGGGPQASLITNTVAPTGIGYSAVSSLVGEGGKIIVGFNYIVSFDAAGGTGTPTATIVAGDTITAPTSPTRDGYEFAGWTVNGSIYNFTIPVTEPITLTATWAVVVAASAELARTGIDPTPGLGVAALLLLAGFALIGLRRRVSAR